MPPCMQRDPRGDAAARCTCSRGATLKESLKIPTSINALILAPGSAQWHFRWSIHLSKNIMNLPAKSYTSPSKSEQTLQAAVNRSVLDPLRDHMGSSTPDFTPLRLLVNKLACSSSRRNWSDSLATSTCSENETEFGRFLALADVMMHSNEWWMREMIGWLFEGYFEVDEGEHVAHGIAQGHRMKETHSNMGLRPPVSGSILLSLGFGDSTEIWIGFTTFAVQGFVWLQG